MSILRTDAMHLSTHSSTATIQGSRAIAIVQARAMRSQLCHRWSTSVDRPYGSLLLTPEVLLTDKGQSPALSCRHLWSQCSVDWAGVQSSMPEPLQGIGDCRVQDDVHRDAHVIQCPGHGQAGLVRAALCHHHTELYALHAASLGQATSFAQHTVGQDTRRHCVGGCTCLMAILRSASTTREWPCTSRQDPGRMKRAPSSAIVARARTDVAANDLPRCRIHPFSQAGSRS